MKWLKYSTLPIGIFMLVLSLLAPKVQASTTQYSITNYYNGYYGPDGNLINESSQQATNKIALNGNIILNQGIYAIQYFDINGIRLSGAPFPFPVGTVVTPPSNVYYFALVGWTNDPTYPTNMTQFQQITVSYENLTPTINLDLARSDLSIATSVNMSGDLDDTTGNIANLFIFETDLNTTVTSVEWVTSSSTPQGFIYLDDYGDGSMKQHGIYLWTRGLPSKDTNGYYYIRVQGLYGGVPFDQLATIDVSEIDGSYGTVPSGGDPESFKGSPITINWLDVDTNQPITQSLTAQRYETIVFPSAPPKEGRNFLHWSVTAGGTIANYPINQVQGSETLLNDYNNTLNATTWNFVPVYETLPQYVVTFVDWDGSFISSGLVYQGQPAPLPTNPSRTGWTFTGWEPPVANIQGDITTVAQYTQNQYLVIWVSDGLQQQANNILHGSGLTPPPNTTKEGFYISGWAINGQSINYNEYVVTQPVQLDAVWTNIPTFQVTWRDQDGQTLKIENVNSGLTGTAPTYTPPAGYQFIEWSPDPTLPISGNTTYIAQIEFQGTSPVPSDYNPISDLFGGVIGSSIGAIMTLGTITLFGIQLSAFIYLFISATLIFKIAKAVRG